MTKSIKRPVGDSPRIVVIACNWVGYTGKEIPNSPFSDLPANVKLVRIMCAARVNRPLILKAFEGGIDGMLILACADAKCLHETGNDLAQARIEATAQLLDQTNILHDRIQFIGVQPDQIDQIPDKIKQFALSLSGLSPIKH